MTLISKGHDIKWKYHVRGIEYFHFYVKKELRILKRLVFNWKNNLIGTCDSYASIIGLFNYIYDPFRIMLSTISF